MEPKQVILVRKDINMSLGKACAQVAHASMKVFFDAGEVNDGMLNIKLTPEMGQWVEGSFVKVCLSVDSEQQLLDLYEQAQNSNLPRSIIKDEGRTTFNGVPTYTTAAIGPADPEKINAITGRLSLYK
jgi:PTH2 family peptidyl-tRNA hydrolase